VTARGIRVQVLQGSRSTPRRTRSPLGDSRDTTGRSPCTASDSLRSMGDSTSPTSVTRYSLRDLRRTTTASFLQPGGNALDHKGVAFNHGATALHYEEPRCTREGWSSHHGGCT
jgi:hypothetical protein